VGIIIKKEKKMVDWKDERLVTVIDKKTGKKIAIVIDVKTGKVVG
tara:strand:- start:118 stop:252 length:135 start_codon:yes stop_codon:yes gene_type:complete